MSNAFFRSLLLVAVVSIGCNRSEPPPAPPTPPAKSELPPGHPPTKAELPPGHPPIDMTQQTLPAGSLADAANPTWDAPGSWQPGKPSSVRRASFIVKGEGDQSADLAVTVFPGDVGGPLANINRWRDQIGLAPINALEADELSTPVTVAGAPATLVDFQNKETSTRMIVITVPHAGNSWFYKLTGPSAIVGSAKADLVRFAQSVKY